MLILAGARRGYVRVEGTDPVNVDRESLLVLHLGHSVLVALSDKLTGVTQRIFPGNDPFEFVTLVVSNRENVNPIGRTLQDVADSTLYNHQVLFCEV